MNPFMILAAAGDDPTKPDATKKVVAHVIKEFQITDSLSFYFTNHIIMTIITAVALTVVFSYVASKCGKKGEKNEDYVTKGVIANFFEVICVFLREEVARPSLGKATDKYIYYIWTTFFFILFANVLGIMPIGYVVRLVSTMPESKYWFGALTTNVSITCGLAVVAFVMTHYVGIKEAGIKGWAAHFCQGPPALWPLMIVLEIVGHIVKPFALMIRLYANIMAGNLLLGSIMGLIIIGQSYFIVPIVLAGSLAIVLLELFVATLQAYIFTFLTVLFMAGFLHHDDEHGHDEEHGDAHAEPAGAH